MFTGIVETTAVVREKTDASLVLERPASFDDVAIGSSISVAGVCLTIVAFDAQSMSFAIVAETWRRTNLGDLAAGHVVNVERSLGVGDRFEGHVVQGHVEGVAVVVAVRDVEPHGREITLRIPSDLLPCVVPKGAVALDGVSLTVAQLEGDRCTIALIPHTLGVTTFKTRAVGDRINVETDVFLRGLRHVRELAIA